MVNSYVQIFVELFLMSFVIGCLTPFFVVKIRPKRLVLLKILPFQVSYQMLYLIFNKKCPCLQLFFSPFSCYILGVLNLIFRISLILQNVNHV